MFFTLLVCTLVVSLACSAGIDRLFRRPISRIVHHIVPGQLGDAWVRYVRFAVYVVGVSGGVKIYALQRYITGQGDQPPVSLNASRWTLEIYRTVVETCQSIVWMLLVVFLVALVAFVILRGFEIRTRHRSGVDHAFPPLRRPESGPGDIPPTDNDASLP